jgi:SRSO17 transposase
VNARLYLPRKWTDDPERMRQAGVPAELIGERPGYGQTGKWKYYFSDFPADTPLEKLVDYAHRRWHIDRFYEDAKNEELGLGDYQGRKWIGFHRHIIIVMLTYGFLAWREWKHRHSSPRRRGRPRDPFSPRRDRRRQSIQEDSSPNH